MEQMNKRVKRRINISVTEDTGERLKQYAKEHHTNVSQAITDWIWSVKVKETNKE
jgi:ABC-type phosphonate transport system ATPase subunit